MGTYPLARLRAQAIALLYAKAVLLIHDHQAQIEELNRFLNDGMRADDDIRLTRDDIQERLALLGGPHGSG